MHVRTLLAASLLAFAGSSAFATTDSQPFVNGVAYFNNPAPLVGSFADTISLTGLSPGTYDFSFSLSGQFMSGVNITVGGYSASVSYFGPSNKYVFAFADVTTGALPLQVSIAGTATGPLAAYSGEVTAVPEPESYALALAGLGGVMLMRRRQREQA